MKTLLIAVLAIALIVALGWVTFSNDDNEANIRIDTQEIRDDTRGLVEKGKTLVNETKEAVNDARTDSAE